MSVAHKSNMILPGLYFVEAAAATNDPFAVWMLGNLYQTNSLFISLSTKYTQYGARQARTQDAIGREAARRGWSSAALCAFALLLCSE